jgi:lipopolysaccharide biosynthesis glycosyltransferase
MKIRSKSTEAILIVLDSNLRFQAASLILNILESQTDGTRIIVIYVYGDETDRLEFQRLVDGIYKYFKYDSQKDFIEIMFMKSEEAMGLTSCFGIPEGSHITSPTFLRLYISELLPSEIEIVLYLDIDILINSSLEPLFSLNFTTPICAELNVPKALGNGKHLQGHDAPYFNAGVMLINMKKWREMKLLDEFIQVGSQRIYPFVDQDILNIVFRNNWTRLGREFNYLHQYGSEEIDMSYSDFPSVIHFAGNKPWNETSVTQFVSKYRRNFNKIRPLHNLLMDC